MESLKVRCKATVLLVLVTGSGNASAGITVNHNSPPPDITPALLLPDVHNIPFSPRQVLFTDEPGVELLPSFSPSESLLHKPSLYQKQRKKGLGKEGEIEDSERLLFLFWRTGQNKNSSSEQELADRFNQLSEDEKNKLRQLMALYFENLIDFCLFGPLLPAGGGEDISPYRERHRIIPLSLITLMHRLLREEVLTEKLIGLLKIYSPSFYMQAQHNLGKTDLKQVIKNRLWLLTGREGGRGEKSIAEPQDSGRFKPPPRQVNENTSAKVISEKKTERKESSNFGKQLKKDKSTSYAGALTKGETPEEHSTSDNNPVGNILIPVAVPADHHCGFHGIARQLATFDYQPQGIPLRYYMSELWQDWQSKGGDPHELFSEGTYELHKKTEPFEEVFYNPWKYSKREKGWLSYPHLFVSSLFLQFYTLVVIKSHYRDKQTNSCTQSVWTLLDMPIPKIGGITSYTLAATKKLLELVNEQDRTLTVDSIQEWVEFQLRNIGESSAGEALKQAKSNLNSLADDPELVGRLDNRPLVILILDRYPDKSHPDHWSAARMRHEDENLGNTYQNTRSSLRLLPENIIQQKKKALPLTSWREISEEVITTEQGLESSGLGYEMLSHISQLLEFFDSLSLKHNIVVNPAGESSESTQFLTDKSSTTGKSSPSTKFWTDNSSLSSQGFSSQSSSYHTSSLLSQKLLSEPADTEDFFSLTGEMFSQLVDETNNQWYSRPATQKMATAVIEPYPELVQTQLTHIAMDMTQESVNRGDVSGNNNQSGPDQQKLPSGVKGINSPGGGAGRGRGRGTKPVVPRDIKPGKSQASSMQPSITISLPPGRIDNSTPGEMYFITPPALKNAESDSKKKINPAIAGGGQSGGRGRGRGTKPVLVMSDVIPVSEPVITESHHVINLVDRQVRQETTSLDRLAGSCVPYDLFRKLRCLGLYAGDIYLVYLNMYHGVCLTPDCEEERSLDPSRVVQVFKHKLPIGMLQQWIIEAYKAIIRNPSEPLEYDTGLSSWFLPGTGVENFDVSRIEEVCTQLSMAVSLGSLRAAYFYGVLKIQLHKETQQQEHIKQAYTLLVNYSLLFSKKNKPITSNQFQHVPDLPESSEYVSLTQSSEYSDACEPVSDMILKWPQQDKRRFSHWTKQNAWAKQAYKQSCQITGEEGYHFQYMDDDALTDFDDSFTTGDITPKQLSPDLDYVEKPTFITGHENKPADFKAFIVELEKLIGLGKRKSAYKYLNKWIASFNRVSYQDFYKAIRISLMLAKNVYGTHTVSADAFNLIVKVTGSWELSSIIEQFNDEGIDGKFYVLTVIEELADYRKYIKTKNVRYQLNRLKIYLLKEWSAPVDMSLNDLLIYVTSLVKDLSFDKSIERIEDADKWLTFAESKKGFSDKKRKHLSDMRRLFDRVKECGSVLPALDNLIVQIMEENNQGRPEQAIRLIDEFLMDNADSLSSDDVTDLKTKKVYSLGSLYSKSYQSGVFSSFKDLIHDVQGEEKNLHILVSAMEAIDYCPSISSEYAVRLINKAAYVSKCTAFEIKRGLQLLARYSLVDNPEYSMFYWQLILGSRYFPPVNSEEIMLRDNVCSEVYKSLEKVEFWKKEEGIVSLKNKYMISVMQEAFLLLYINGYFEQALLIGEYIIRSWKNIGVYFKDALGHERAECYRNEVFCVMMIIYSVTDNNEKLNKYWGYLNEKKCEKNEMYKVLLMLLNDGKTSLFIMNDSDSPKTRYAKVFVWYMFIAYSMASFDRHDATLSKSTDELVHYLSDSRFQIGFRGDYMKLLAQIKKLYMTHQGKLEQSGTVIKSMSGIDYLKLIEHARGKRFFIPWLPFTYRGGR